MTCRTNAVTITTTIVETAAAMATAHAVELSLSEDTLVMLSGFGCLVTSFETIPKLSIKESMYVN